MNLLKQGAAWLQQQLSRHGASGITYRRGATDTEHSATFGRTTYEVEDEYGLRVGAEVMDFLIAAESFPYDAPQTGDRIMTEDAVYEVLSLSGQGHWRWSDPYRITMRIHTKEIAHE